MTHTERLSVLLGGGTSRTNKLHLAESWGIPCRWTKDGESGARLMFERDGKWVAAKSWEQDVAPNIKWLKNPRAEP